MHFFPKAIGRVCLQRRDQAVEFNRNFLQKVVQPESNKQALTATIDTVIASWTDIAIIFNFFREIVLTQEEESNEFQQDGIV